MAKIKVGVLRGGPSSEHEVSLKTGENVLRFLPDKYQGVDLVLQKDGQCFFDGSPLPFQKVSHLADVVFNALHGYFGEDGKIQQILGSIGIPYTGSGPLASALAMNKFLSRNIFEKAGLKMPKAVIVNNNEPLKEAVQRIFHTVHPFWVVKPASGGSSIGISIVRDFNDLISAMERAFNFEIFDSTVIVEEYIKGREVTCGILENFRGEEYYALPVTEIVPAYAEPACRQGRASAGKPLFFDYEAKYNGLSREICPAHLDLSLKKEIENIARSAHKVLGCESYSRADMIVSPACAGRPRGIYLLEVNTLPGLTSESLVPKAAAVVSLDFPNLLDHLINLALNKKKF